MFKTFFSILFLTFFVFGCSDKTTSDADSSKPKYVILMIADGMGLGDVTASRIYKNGLSGDSLDFEQLENVGYQRTYSKNSVITDSAAAATAMATGYKVNNGEISFNSKRDSGYETILEVAKNNNFKTALIVTSSVTHATPAAFASHVVSRNCQNEISNQLIKNKVDYLFGGGLKFFNSTAVDVCGASGNILTDADTSGYKIIYDNNELISLTNETKVLGLFASDGLTPMINRTDTMTEPTLSQMTEKALDLLSVSESSFFMMIEGSQIDWANHGNNLSYQVNEVLEFNNAYIKVKEWIAKEPDRKDNTLVIITSDHETGGFAINGPSGSLLNQGDFVTDAWTSTGHTGMDVMVWSEGPYSEELKGNFENTHIFLTMQSYILK